MAQVSAHSTTAKASRGPLRVNAVAAIAPPKIEKATPLELGYTMPGDHSVPITTLFIH